MGIKINNKALDFKLKDQNENIVKLSDFKGKNIVLYFYPKDNTPGCSLEAKNFRDSYKKIKEKDAIVIGISADSCSSHQKFIEKLNLPFVLLSDPDKKAIFKYGCLKEKNMFGKKVLSTERSTFIIDKEFKIKHTFRNVKVDGHSEEILNALNSL